MSDETTGFGLTTNTEKALKRGRRALDMMMGHWERDDPTDLEIDSYLDSCGDLFDAFISMDVALSRGGPLPIAWSLDPDLENFERGSRYPLQRMTDAAIERHRSRGRLQLITGDVDDVAEEDNAPKGEGG